MNEPRKRIAGGSRSALIWAGGAFTGGFIEKQNKGQIIPEGLVCVAPRKISNALINDAYTGFFRIVPLAVPLIAVASKIYGQYSNDELKSLKKSLQVKSFCVASGDWTKIKRPINEHPTWDYVKLALQYMATGDTAFIDDAWRKGSTGKGSRYVEENLKLRTDNWSRENAEAYIARIIGLARIIRECGSLPSPKILESRSGRRDDNVGIAIDENGEVLHFRKGHHRMMLARQLDIEKMEAEIHVVHAKWIRKELGVDPGSLYPDSGGATTTQRYVQDAIRQYVQR